MKVTFQAHRGDALLSRAIRLLSPKYNHISIRVENEVFEAHIKTGVTKTPYKIWKGKTSVVAKQELFIDDIRGLKLVAFLNKQVGKKYDVLGIFSFLWVYFRPKKDRWYCSEYAQVALYKCLGIRSTENDYNQKVSPYQFWRNLRTVKKAFTNSSL